jgi:glycosyltransferase involved in cell wall biosynthesis
MTVRVFLKPLLAAMQEHYDLTVVVNTKNAALLRELGVVGTLKPLAIERSVSVRRDLQALLSLTWLMRASRFDLVQSMTPKAGLLAMVASWLARTPARVHTFTGQVWATRRGLSRMVFRGLDRVVARCATFTLADSPSQRAFLIREGVVPAAKVFVLGSGSVSGVDPTRFRPDPALRRSVRERLAIGLHEVVLLFVGRLTRDKGVLDLARAFAALADDLPDVRLVLVGPDEQQMRPAMCAVCRRHLARMHFIEFTAAPEEVMAAADVICLPSFREGFGSVLIEAASVGVPAVASRIYGIVDAVVDHTTGLLHEPGDVAGLLAHLRRLARDPALRRALGDAARARVVREFPERRLVSAQLEVYARLIDGRPPVPGIGIELSETAARPTLAADAGGYGR